MAEATDAIQVRFRSTHGDVGPFPFNEQQSIQALKDKLFAEWPKDGALSKEPPSSSNDIRLILSGKYVDNVKSLKDYRKDMGELKPDTIVTMHIVVRPSNAPVKQSTASAPGQQDQAQKGCGCTIS
mmetsp:Transcript_14705/g.36645  ORF Transcript_14705/g.36645 Transcript_14705/m.36645 type:complete len:126 (+) Transcript_14705:73-450(+)